MGHIGNVAISASAGTGKTYTLAVRYIQLLSAGFPAESIAAMTFTRMAAGEILGRIILLLCEWMRDREAYEESRAANGLEGLEHGSIPGLLRNILLNLHKLKISTLDSFYAGIIKSFPFEFGLSGDFRIIEQTEEREQKNLVLREILYGGLDSGKRRQFLFDFKRSTYGSEEKRISDLLSSFVDEHLGIYTQAPDIRMWQGIGSVWGGYPPGFDRDDDIRELGGALVDALKGMGLNQRQLEMLEGFISESLGEYGYLNQESKRVFEKLLEMLELYATGSVEITLDRRKVTFGVEECELLDRFLRCLIRKKLKVLSEKTAGIFSVLRSYDTVYESLVRANGFFTFADMLHRLSRASVDPSCGQTLSCQPGGIDKLYIDYRLDARIRHWLLDEFQDTSFEQWRVIENLIDEVMQDTSGERSFFYVGDVKQSIYQWREGDPRLFGIILDQYSEKYGNIVKKPLVKSYRSCREITDTVNLVFGGLMGSCEGYGIPREVVARMDWKEHESNVKTSGYAQLISLDYDKTNKRPDSETGMRIRAGIIAKTILSARPVERRLSTAVLLRTHTHQQLIASELARHGIPVTLGTSSGILGHPFASALLSLLAVAEHPGDEYAWQHLLMTPLSKHLSSRGGTVMELLEDIFENGYRHMSEKWLGRLCEMTGRPAGGEGILRRIYLAAEEFDSGKLYLPHEFAEFLEGYEVKFSTAPNSVQIMTIHAAKGLGFDVVFLPELSGARGMMTSDVSKLQVKKDSSRCPEWVFMVPDKQLSLNLPGLREFIDSSERDACFENLCTLYVSMTRAAKALYMVIERYPSESLQPWRLLEGALAAGEPVANTAGGLTLYSVGSHEWYRAYDEKAPDDLAATTPGDPIPAPLDFSGLRHSTPSGSEKRVITAGDLFSNRERVAMDIGSAVHELFASLEWAGYGEAEKALANWKNSSGYSAGTVAEASKLFTGALRSEDVRCELRRPEGNVELWRERSFSVLLDNHLLNGTFDRVEIRLDADGRVFEAEILDYKTDSAYDEEELNSRVDVYRPQLELYSRALSKILELGMDKIRLKLLFVRPGRIIELKSRLAPQAS